MIKQEAIYRLESYDELKAKYNEALEKIVKYKKERTAIKDRICRTFDGNYEATLIDIANMLNVKPTYLNDDLEVGDIIKDDRDGEIGLYIGKGTDGVNRILKFRYEEGFCDTFRTYSTEHWKKTGKHYPQIAEILAELRGENDEQQT